jgi:hypothetical protein
VAAPDVEFGGCCVPCVCRPGPASTAGSCTSSIRRPCASWISPSELPAAEYRRLALIAPDLAEEGEEEEGCGCGCGIALRRPTPTATSRPRRGLIQRRACKPWPAAHAPPCRHRSESRHGPPPPLVVGLTTGLTSEPACASAACKLSLQPPRACRSVPLYRPLGERAMMQHRQRADLTETETSFDRGVGKWTTNVTKCYF